MKNKAFEYCISNCHFSVNCFIKSQSMVNMDSILINYKLSKLFTKNVYFKNNLRIIKAITRIVYNLAHDLFGRQTDSIIN